YERDHHFNLWFTLAVPGITDVGAELLRLADVIEAEAVFELPVVKFFKLRTYFSPDEDDQSEAPSGIPDDITNQSVDLSPVDREIINALQQDLPLISRPFAEMSALLKMDEGEFLAQCQSLLARGVVRRFGAAVNHRRAGFAANAMTCWAVPAEKVKIMAETLVSLKQVSHCYERKTNPEWPYNLFAMIHGNTREQCRESADRASAEAGLLDYVLLFSTREFKKTRVVYQV
ncbi:Lrp/AsnC family transcriptional regulator, partial [Chloroflexota bacterium]